MLYRKKPDVYEAFQFIEFSPEIPAWCTAMSGVCPICGGWMYLHGRLNGRCICPGDYICEDRHGIISIVNPSVMDADYEEVKRDAI